MTKRITLVIAVVAATILFSSAAFAGEANSVSNETFLASLQASSATPAPEAPTLISTDNVPAPAPMACTYSCRSCINGKLKFCSTCNGVTSCGACTTACPI